MRTITDHKVTSLNELLVVAALDGPGPGGASHSYVIHADESKTTLKDGVTVYHTFNFQNGPIQEVGVNGISGEALIAITIDRLRSFQTGPFSCRENAIALTHLETALLWLHKRTLDRVQRGVEGTMQK